jgi:uncharacterized protein YegP (UPF0339 family)
LGTVPAYRPAQTTRHPGIPAGFAGRPSGYPTTPLEVADVQILIDSDGGQHRWRLVRRTAHGADLLARGARSYADERACYRAAALLCDAAAEAMLVVQQPDGHWRWRVVDRDGELLAESPAVFRDAASCGRALAELRRQVCSLPVA